MDHDSMTEDWVGDDRQDQMIRRGKAAIVMVLGFIYGAWAVGLGVAWISSTAIDDWSTLAFTFVVIPLGLVWAIDHRFMRSRRVETWIIVVPATIALAIVIAVAVMNVNRIDWEQALWGLGAFVYLVLGAAAITAVCIRTDRNNT